MLTYRFTLDSAIAVLCLWWPWPTWRTSIVGALESKAHNLLRCGWWWCLVKRLAGGWWHLVMSWETLALFDRTAERRDGWKGGVMWPKCSRERWLWRQGRFGEWAGGAHNPCGITWCDHADKLVVTCTADPTIRSCFRILIPHVSSTLWYDKLRISCIFILQLLYKLPII